MWYIISDFDYYSIYIGIFFFISDSKNKKKGKIKKDQKPSKFCPNCGREVSFDTKFCQYCGWKIN